MKLVYFVKDGCEACENAKEKIAFFLDKWGLTDSIETEAFSVSTSDGLVEVSMREIADIPTIVLEDAGDEVARWTKRAPTSEELRKRLAV